MATTWFLVFFVMEMGVTVEWPRQVGGISAYRTKKQCEAAARGKLLDGYSFFPIPPAGAFPACIKYVGPR